MIIKWNSFSYEYHECLWPPNIGLFGATDTNAEIIQNITDCSIQSFDCQFRFNDVMSSFDCSCWRLSQENSLPLEIN